MKSNTSDTLDLCPNTSEKDQKHNQISSERYEGNSVTTETNIHISEIV
jgi:hypothetical protein